MTILTQIAPAHAQVLAAIHAVAFPPDERWDAAAMAELLAMPGTFGLIADAEGFILARVAADEAEILTLAVLPARTRQGLASQLLAATLRIAKAAGAAAMLLEVAEPNLAARGLYAVFGFGEVGRRRRYYADGSDALVLRLDLS